MVESGWRGGGEAILLGSPCRPGSGRRQQPLPAAAWQQATGLGWGKRSGNRIGARHTGTVGKTIQHTHTLPDDCSALGLTAPEPGGRALSTGPEWTASRKLFKINPKIYTSWDGWR